MLLPTAAANGPAKRTAMAATKAAARMIGSWRRRRGSVVVVVFSSSMRKKKEEKKSKQRRQQLEQSSHPEKKKKSRVTSLTSTSIEKKRHGPIRFRRLPDSISTKSSRNHVRTTKCNFTRGPAFREMRRRRCTREGGGEKENAENREQYWPFRKKTVNALFRDASHTRLAPSRTSIRR